MRALVGAHTRMYVLYLLLSTTIYFLPNEQYRSKYPMQYQDDGIAGAGRFPAAR